MCPTDTEIRGDCTTGHPTQVHLGFAEISVEGSSRKVPSVQIDGRTVIVTGRWLKLASVHDEEWEDGTVVPSPDGFIAKLLKHGVLERICLLLPRSPQTQFLIMRTTLIGTASLLSLLSRIRTGGRIGFLQI